MKARTQVLIIGGGIAGCSLLHHLTRLGVGDCALVEKQELTAGTTWHSAACITHFSHSSFISGLHERTTRLYEALERETGQPTGFHRTGSIRLALSADQMAEIRRFAGFAKRLDIPFELLTPEEVGALHPLVSLDGVQGALHTPMDGWVDAHQSTHAFASGARRGGAEIYRHTRVTGLRRRSGGDWEVETDRGTIVAGTVVNAAGLWGNEIAAMAGVSLPLVAVELSYLVTDGIPEIAALDRELPVLRGLDGSYYLRQERDGMLIGVYEDRPVFWNVDGIPADFGQEYLPGDLERVEGSVTAAMARVPVLAEAGIKNLICGPAQRTPDFHGLLGPVPGCPNLFSYAGFVAGISQAPALGESMAQWIVRGQPDVDLWPYDLRRFGTYADRGYTMARVDEAFTFGYRVVYPDMDHEAGRPRRKSPIHERLAARGGVFRAFGGWERPLMFAPGGSDSAAVQPTFGPPTWLELVGAECLAVQRGAGILDRTATAKFEVSGTDAAEFLGGLSASTLPATIGDTAQSLMLNASGGIECCFDVTRLAHNRFYLTAPAEAEVHHLDWLRRHAAPDGDVSIGNVTERDGILLVVGPRSPDILARLVGGSLAGPLLRPNTAHHLVLETTPVRAHKYDALGEIGWELHHRIDDQETLYDAVMTAGESCGVVDFGVRAESSLRLEMGLTRWKHELTSTSTPYEAGLETLVYLEKGDFIGRDALLAHRRETGRRLAWLTVEASDTWLWGDEPIFHEGRAVALTIRCSYGHRVGKLIASSHLPVELAAPGTPLEVEVLGTRVPCHVVSMPLYARTAAGTNNSLRASIG